LFVTPTDAGYKAQFGEDRLLDEYFGGKRDGFFVEIGAYDGVRMSNTFFFEQQGWSGILVEADAALAEQCRIARPRSTVLHCAIVGPDAPDMVTFQVSEDWKSLSSLSFDASRRAQLERLSGGFRISEVSVPGRTMDSILEANGVGQIDFVTIDVEGHEWDVLRGFSIDRWKPGIVIVERNTLFPDHRIVRHMFETGYRYLRTTGVNDWFERGSITSTEILSFAANLYVRRPASEILKRSRKRARKAVRTVLGRVGLLDVARRLFR
jgi:FkbM family methyltransferase